MEYVTLAALADELHLDRSNLRKYALKKGYAFAAVRTPESHNQATLALTLSDAESVRRLREAEGFGVAGPGDSQPSFRRSTVQLLKDGSNPRRRIRQWVKELTQGRDEISIPDITDEVIARIHDDVETMRALLYDGVYEEVRGQIGASRSWFLAGERALNEEALAAKAERLKSRWSRWLEHANGHHIRLMTMTRLDLLAAAAERRKRAETEVRIARLWEAMADQMAEGQTVGEVFDPEQIDALNIVVNDGAEIPPEDQAAT